ncbi:MAG: histidine kinase [Ignavibacteriales bacterium]|nr:histidine kinase [Ignavibacteriales bacterium]
MRKFLFVAGIWFILGLIYSGQSFFYYLSIGQEFLWQKSLLHSFVFFVEWALLTVPVLRLAERFCIDSKNFFKNIIFHFFVGIAIGLCQQTIFVISINYIDGGFSFQHTLRQMLPSIVGFFEFGVLIYWSLVFIFHALSYYRNFQDEKKHATELHTQLIESQLQTLKMQLQPHFLFNTLNAISVLVKKKPALAQKMITRLSDLLRLTLERGLTNEVSLERELEFLSAYLSIEKVRFGERLKVKIHIDENILSALVPTFLLQPLAENSIRHGIASRSGDGWIEVKAEQQNGTLLIEVIDGGIQSRRAKKKHERSGVGLENIQQRLQKLYGAEFYFDFKENDTHGATVKMTIPLKIPVSSIPT